MIFKVLTKDKLEKPPQKELKRINKEVHKHYDRTY